MVSRPRSHVIAEEGVTRVTSILNSFGWTCEPISRDYGEDLSARVFERGKATAKYIFVQCKASDNCRFTREGTLRFRFGRPLLRLWQTFRQPVVVTLLDMMTGVVYWQPVQDYLELLPGRMREHAQSVLFWKQRRLTNESEEDLGQLATRSYLMGDGGRSAFEHLTELLSEQYGMEVMLDAGGAFVLPPGRFVPDKSATGFVRVETFGELADIVRYVEEEQGMSVASVVRDAIERRERLERGFKRDGSIVVDGHRFTDLNRFHEYQAAKLVLL